MATGIPNLSWISLDDGNEMPGRMRLDTFETSWDRRTVDEERRSIETTIPYNATRNTDTVNISDLSDSSTVDATSYRIVVTVPKISKTVNGVGVISATIQGQDSGSPGWVAVASQSTTGTATDDANGFQIDHKISTTTYDQYRVQYITGSVSSQAITSLSAFVDFYFVGNQRRNVKNIVSTVETNHQSAFSDKSETLLGNTTLQNPVFYIAPNIAANDMIKRKFTGTYNIDRISIDRGEGRLATIIMSLTNEGAWQDE